MGCSPASSTRWQVLPPAVPRAGVYSRDLARGKGVRVERAQGGKGHPGSDRSSAPYAASVLVRGTPRVPRACPPGVTLTFSPSQTPPGMSPSAGAYLQMAVSFNYRCLALFTDTGYIWMGLATLKVSVSLPSPRWGIRVSAHPSSPCPADRSSSAGGTCGFPWGPRGLGAAGRPRCRPQASALLPSGYPRSFVLHLTLYLTPHFFCRWTHLFAGLAPPRLCPNSPQINSLLLITFSPPVTVLLRPYPSFLVLVPFPERSQPYHHCWCGHFSVGAVLASHDSALQTSPRCGARAGEVLVAFHTLRDQSFSFAFVHLPGLSRAQAAPCSTCRQAVCCSNGGMFLTLGLSAHAASSPFSCVSHSPGCLQS